MKFSARNKFTGKVLAVKVKERRNGAERRMEEEGRGGQPRAKKSRSMNERVQRA